MKRNTMLKWLNPMLAALLANQAVTGLCADELPRNVFEALHEGGGIALAAAAALHLTLNWNWVRNSYRRAVASREGTANKTGHSG